MSFDQKDNLLSAVGHGRNLQTHGLTVWTLDKMDIEDWFVVLLVQCGVVGSHVCYGGESDTYVLDSKKNKIILVILVYFCQILLFFGFLEV